MTTGHSVVQPLAPNEHLRSSYTTQIRWDKWAGNEDDNSGRGSWHQKTLTCRVCVHHSVSVKKAPA
jgi:hypothetical protein